MRGLTSSQKALIFSTMIWSCFFVALPAMAAVDHLVISQVQIGGVDGANDEFVEIYNPTASDLDLTGWSVKKKTSSTSSTESNLADESSFTGKIIKAQGFFLIAKRPNDDGTLNYTGSSTPDTYYSGKSFYLTNDNAIFIYDSSKQLVDKVGFGEASDYEAAPAPNPPYGQALIRIFSDGQVIDTDNNSVDFIVELSHPRNSSSTPGTTTSTPESEKSASSSWESLLGMIKISEILPNPEGTDDGNEAVELLNTGTTTIDLDGWFLDDKTDSGIKDKAYQITEQSILPGEYLTVIIPVGHFPLNNTGGDEVNLYFPDKTLADKVSYTGDAPDDQSWQNVGGQWMWAPKTLGQANAAPPVQTSGSGSESTGYQTTNTPVTATTVSITEFLPNPVGADEGNEWVELYNSGSSSVNLAGWILDDRGASAQPGSSAYVLDSSFKISAKKYLVITIPKGKFVLDNANGDILRLFRPDKSLAQSISFTQAPEGESFAVDKDSKWAFTTPTPGFGNVFNVPKADVVISELLPNPNEDEDEFVEIFNAGSEPISLEGFKLRIGTREKIFGDITLASSTGNMAEKNAYYVLYEDDLPVKLRNSGQAVILLDNLGRELSSVVYGKASRGQAFALSNGSYLWTELATAGEENKIVLSASTDISKSSSTEKSGAQTKEASATKLYNETKKLNEELSQKLDNLQAMVAMLSEQSQPIPPAAIQAADKQEIPIKSEPSWLYLALAGLAAAMLALLVKQYFWKKSFK